MLRINIIIISAIMALVMSLSATVYAQDDIREKIEKIKLEKMVKKMDLDDATAETFKTRYSTFSKSMKELTKKRAKAYIEMTLNIEGGNGLDSLVEQVLSLENQINQERMDFVNDLKSILTSKQIATMIVFERRFNNQLQKLLKEYRNKKNRGIGE